MDTSGIKISYPDGIATSQIDVSGLSDQVDGNIFFYSPLVGTYFQDAINCYNNGCFFATIALAQAAVEHAIVFELGGGYSLQVRNPIKLPRNSRKYIYKVDKFVEAFPIMKQFRNDIKKLYELYRNTWLHGITGRIKINKSQKPELSEMGTEEILCNSGQHKEMLAYQIKVWSTSEKSPGCASTIGKEFQLILASRKIAKNSLIIAGKVLKNIQYIYHPKLINGV